MDNYLEQERLDDLMIDIISDMYLEDYRKYLYFQEQNELYELYSLLRE
jgi:hypothetical protein